MGFILSRLAVLLFLITGPVNFFIVMIKHARKFQFIKTTNGYFFDDALNIDVFGNYRYRATWNLLFRTKHGYRFGVKGETISSALGKNQRDNTLSIGGMIMVVILWICDFKYWRKGGHCMNSIMTEDEIILLATK